MSDCHGRFEDYCWFEDYFLLEERRNKNHSLVKQYAKVVISTNLTFWPFQGLPTKKILSLKYPVYLKSDHLIEDYLAVVHGFF